MKYNVKYEIDGVYGMVTIYKKLVEFKDKIDEIESNYIHMNLRSIEAYTNNENYFTFNYELLDDYYNTVMYSKDVVVGLPKGITEDIYYKIALNQNLKRIADINKSNREDILKSIKELSNTIILASGGNVIKK